MRIVKGILIDPFACTVTEVEHDASGIEGIYKLLSHETMEVSTFECAYSGALGEGDAVFVDEEGLFKNAQRFFLYPGNPQPLAGKGLILGSDSKGDSVSAKTPIDFVKNYVEFLEVSDERTLAATRTPWMQA